ncbi:hypothetical protein [Streptomyces sp. BRA346]
MIEIPTAGINVRQPRGIADYTRAFNGLSAKLADARKTARG